MSTKPTNTRLPRPLRRVIARAAKKLDMPTSRLAEIVTYFLEYLAVEIAKGPPVEIPALGRFAVADRHGVDGYVELRTPIFAPADELVRLLVSGERDQGSDEQPTVRSVMHQLRVALGNGTAGLTKKLMQRDTALRTQTEREAALVRYFQTRHRSPTEVSASAKSPRRSDTESGPVLKGRLTKKGSLSTTQW